MKNLKFKTRLIIGYSIVIVLSLIIGLIGLNQIKRIGNDSDLIYNHPLKVSNAVRDINVNINAIHRHMNEVSNSNNSNQLTQILDEINKYDSIIISDFNVVKSRFLGDKTIIENTKELYKESRIIRHKIFEAKIKGANLEAIKILKSEGIKHKELLFLKTKELTDFAQNKANEFYKSTIETRQNSLIIITSVTILLLIISLITAVLISQSILKPIHKFIVEVKKIFNDNKYLDIKYNTISEQKVFENTIVEIRNAYHHIEDQKVKLEKFNIELDQKVEERTKKLLISEELNRSITESANDAIISIDSNGKILTWNKASEKIFGFKAIDMIGENLHKLVPTKYIVGHEEGLERLRNGEVEKLIGKTIDISAIGKNGIEFPIELSLSKWKSDNNNYYTGIIRDITERKKNKEALIESKNRFETLIQQAGDAIFLADFDGNIIEVNNSACKSLGYKREELLSLKISDIDGNYSHLEEQRDFWENLKNNISQTIETIHIKKDGTRVEVEINLGLFHIDNRKAILGFSRNITIRKQNEKELIEAKEKAEENDSLKTKFLNNLSHEIRTPMNGILGFSQFLSDPNITKEKRSYFVNIIQSSGNQLLNIIDDILEISRLETKQVKLVEEEICLNDLLLELFAIFDLKAKENKTPLYFKKGCSDIKSTIYTDSTKLVKIISNLLENALKFTRKGFIEFGYKLVEKEHVKMLEVFVKDTGVGIKQKDIELIFERFSQAEKELSLQAGGLGLGLSIAKENTELLGGEIFVDSEFGKGTTFSILIPYKPVNIEIDSFSYKNSIKKTILIAEDEEINFLYFETLIKEILDIKCNILHAKNGEQAINMCKENSKIDIVLMDLKMPIINGYKATEQIRIFNHKIPIIAQTAYSTVSDREKAKLAGCNDFISKPIDKKTLKSIIEKYTIQE